MLVRPAIVSIDREFTLRSSVCVSNGEQPLPFRHRLTGVPTCDARALPNDDRSRNERVRGASWKRATPVTCDSSA